MSAAQSDDEDTIDAGHREIPLFGAMTYCPYEASYYDRDVHPMCFDENWDSSSKRRSLWGAAKTAVPAERQVSHILSSKVSHIVVDCDHVRAHELRATLREAHAPSIGIKVYALFSIDDLAFSEADKVPDVAAWNTQCARCPNERFDGVAINNERFSDINCDNNGSEEEYLDRVWDPKVAAAAAGLDLHMSLGWRWGLCDRGGGVVNNLSWAPPGSLAVVNPANHHFIDILDSIDVQVSWNVAGAMENRALTSGVEYAATLGKPFWILAYTNPHDSGDCRFTFFPDALGCTQGVLTEAGMWGAFDTIMASSAISSTATTINAGIHYFHGTYGSGLPGWPKHFGPYIVTDLCAETHNLFMLPSSNDD